MNFRPSVPKVSIGRLSRRSTRGRPREPSGSNRSATFTPSAAEMRLSEAMLAFARPRSTWLRKLSESPDRSATVRSVTRRTFLIARSRRPTSNSRSSEMRCDVTKEN
jgi:hypothetical protein